MDATGTVQGNTILLEKPLPELQGKRVHLQVEAIQDPDRNLSPQEAQDAWKAWAESGPQGPIEDGDESDWP